MVFAIKTINERKIIINFCKIYKTTKAIFDIKFDQSILNILVTWISWKINPLFHRHPKENLDNFLHYIFANREQKVVINSLPQVMSVKARSFVSQIARIIAWPSWMVKQLTRCFCVFTYRKSSIRPCMKLWKLLCLVIAVSASSAMLPNTWEPQKKGSQKGASGITNLCHQVWFF